MARGIKRSKAEKEEHLNQISALYVKGVTQAEIGRRVGLSQPQVSNDIKVLLKRWDEQRMYEIDRHKSEQLARINTMEAELWEAWEKSKTLRKVTVNKSKSGDILKDTDFITGKPIKIQDDKYWKVSSTEEEPGSGDMQYMNGIMWCVSERSKILGLNAPQKIAQTDPTGEHESISAKQILGDIIGGILRKGDSKENPALGQNSDTTDNSDAVDAEVIDETPELVKRLNMERAKRLNPYTEDSAESQNNTSQNNTSQKSASAEDSYE